WPRGSGFARRLVTNEIAADFESLGSELWRRSFGGNHGLRLRCCGHGEGGWGSLRPAVGAHRAQPFKEKRPLSSGQIARDRHVAWMFDGKPKRPDNVPRKTRDTVVIIEVHHGMRCRETREGRVRVRPVRPRVEMRVLFENRMHVVPCR